LGLCEDSLERIDNINKDINLFDHKIYYQKNYGCDVAPFLNQIQTVSEPTFIKLHSKKSSWGVKNNLQWRSVLVNDLIGSKTIFDNNREKVSDPDIGMISNKNLLLNDREGHNKKIIKKIANLMDIDYSYVENSSFPAGNMFFSKTEIYKKYFTFDICDKLHYYLKKEKGKIQDSLFGTYSHSLERIFGYIIKYDYKIFDFPNHNIIKIINKDSDKGYYSLVITYDNNCYLEEDLNACGSVVEKKDNIMIIKWLHMPVEVYQQYSIIDKQTIIKDQNAKSSFN
jgi:hypothetical protein